MERLDFVLPDFTRLSWVSDAARDVWETRLSRITTAWQEIEWLAVVAAVRPCGVTMASPEEFLRRAGAWAKHGLNALPVEIMGVSNYSYSSTGVATEMGKPFLFRFVLGTPRDVCDFQSAWDAGDQHEIGRLLGYPSCCREFFRQVWVDDGMVDTTWPMARATAAPANGVTAVEVTGPWQANILWRWMGVRAVPHLPCRFDCTDTVELADRFVAVGRKAGYESEMDWLQEMLSWPVEWSALHGIAEIKTPVLKVSTRTDATARKYVVRYQGDAYPAEGARGLTFPYRMPRAPHLTASPGFRRGLANPIEILDQQPEWLASDNGFRSSLAMDQAQEPIVALATATLAGNGGNVLDLGCGNGALLKKIHASNRNTVLFGIEVEPGAVEHARVLNREFADNFVLGDMFENDLLWSGDRRYTLVLLMPGRLLEAGPERAARLKDRLKQHCDYVLVYAYDDWLARYQDLRGLARAAGIRLLSAGADARADLADVG